MKLKHIVSRLSVLVIVFYSLASCSSDTKEEPRPEKPELNLVGDAVLPIAAGGGGYSISYELLNPIEGEVVEAVTDAAWIDRFVCEEGKVTFDVDENPETQVREADITVRYATLHFKVKAVQEGAQPAPEIELLSDAQIDADFTGGSFEVRYTVVNPVAGEELRVEVKEQGWITGIEVEQEAVKFRIAANESSDPRENTLTLIYEEATATVAVRQKGKSGGAYDHEFNAPRLDGFYYGDAYSPGAGNYWFFLSDKGLDANGNAMPDGTFFLIDLYSDIASDPAQARIPTGVFTLDPAPNASCAKGTFSRQNSRFYNTDANGKAVNSRAFDTATLKITESGNGYLIELNCMTNEENKLWYVYYSGDTLLENMAE